MRLGFGRVLGDCMFCWQGGEREGGRRRGEREEEWGRSKGRGRGGWRGEERERGRGGGEGRGVGMHNAVILVGNNNGCFSYHNFHMKRFSIPQSCMN